MRSILFLLVATLVLAGTPPALACGPTTSPAPANTCAIQSSCFYVVVDVCTDCVSIWVYQESNGRSGLQRHDSFDDDTCSGAYTGDTRIL
ncbi:MAG TPA: hypothetical protein VM370_11975 [Candidatus Thermoplasmatota archaeon]|nr:hypothetical protein [Candidatus Thermoplasmatota archaeon]